MLMAYKTKAETWRQTTATELQYLLSNSSGLVWRKEFEEIY
jgi:hypothetical protein